MSVSFCVFTCELIKFHLPSLSINLLIELCFQGIDIMSMNFDAILKQKSKKKRERKDIVLEVKLIPPTKDKYTEVNVAELIKEQLVIIVVQIKYWIRSFFFSNFVWTCF